MVLWVTALKMLGLFLPLTPLPLVVHCHRATFIRTVIPTGWVPGCGTSVASFGPLGKAGVRSFGQEILLCITPQPLAIHSASGEALCKILWLYRPSKSSGELVKNVVSSASVQKHWLWRSGRGTGQLDKQLRWFSSIYTVIRAHFAKHNS